MKTEKGKIKSIFELKRVSPTAEVQRFSFQDKNQNLIYINCFNNFELLKGLKVDDVVELQYNPVQKGNFLNNYLVSIKLFGSKTKEEIEQERIINLRKAISNQNKFEDALEKQLVIIYKSIENLIVQHKLKHGIFIDMIRKEYLSNYKIDNIGYWNNYNTTAINQLKEIIIEKSKEISK